MTGAGPPASSRPRTLYTPAPRPAPRFVQSIVFAHTARQVRARAKTVTRRIGWRTLAPGTLLRVIDRDPRSMRGAPKEIAVIRVLDVRREVLADITAEEVAAEGFPGMQPSTFVRMFAAAMQVERDAIVTRIAFEYLELADCPKPEPIKVPPAAAPPPAGAPAAPAAPGKRRAPRVRSTTAARVRASLEGKGSKPPRPSWRDHWNEGLDLFGDLDPRTPVDE